MDRFSAGDPESQFGCFESGAQEKNQLSTLAGTCPVCRLYVHVTEFSPAREEEVIVMQQVTEIYGRQNGWSILPTTQGIKLIRCSRRSEGRR